MQRRLTQLVLLVLIAASGGVLAGKGPVQDGAVAASPVQVKKIPAPYTAPSSGRAMYLAYCASCHGKDGKGDGPAASAMKSFPGDLTELAARNRGTFPESHVIQIIQGDSNSLSHGSKDMPVWGPVFRAMGTQGGSMVQLRIRNLTRYIASVQRK